MDSEQQNIREILAGNSQAFRKLVENYQRLVSHIVFRLIPNPDQREDICQEVFLKVYQNLTDFRFRSKLSTWIGKIAYHTSLHYLEKKKVLLYRDLNDSDDPIGAFAATEKSPGKMVEQTDTLNHLINEIEKLPPVYRSVLTLFHLDGMSYHEIAEIMDLPEGTVKSYLFRARKHLKNKLVEKYQPEEL
ncbi:MAG TPA: sigma-70 family RNA polymerase sigma factor [Caldithrix sp.]|nr:sigma-70 family RNA polymerase sigma factor [Caldithrix sp.]